MLFYEPLFLFLFGPAVYLIYLFFGEVRLRRAIILFAASVIFYAWSEPVFIFLVFASVALDLYVAQRIAAAPEHKERKLWLALGVVANLAKPPQGGDSDQIKAVAAGECAVTLANTYYFVRFLASDKPEDQAIAAKVQWIFPNQSTTGAHVNISGAGIAKYAPNREAAVKFLEFLASDEAQNYFAAGNNEYPIAGGDGGNAALAKLGDFKADQLNVSAYGENQPAAQEIMDRVGWK